jgi:hypothetical protein
MLKHNGIPTNRERFGVVFAIFIVHFLLWRAKLPLPHVDLLCFGEPALLLATTGKIAAPASQYLDLTYVLGSYFYPPGYIVVMAGWLKVFGTSIYSWLGYTHIIHGTYLFLLWLLLRQRLHCTRLAAGLAVCSAFPYFSYGRPDLTSLLLGVAAWLLLPDRLQQPRLISSGLLLGIAVLVSPPFGLSSSVAIGCFYVFRFPNRGWERFWGLLVLAGVAIATLIGLWALILTWQGAWAFALEQFRVHSSNRGADLNTWPQPPLLYGIAFISLPLVVLTLIPAIAVVFLYRFSFKQPLVAISLAYLSSFSLWFSLSKSALLMSGYHFLLLARPILHGMLASTRKPLQYLTIAGLIAFSLLNFYFYKDDFLAIAATPNASYEQIAAISLEEDAIALIDSSFFPILYRPGKTLNYFTTIQENSWQRYRNSTASDVLDLLPQGPKTQPPIADIIVASALTLSRNALPDPAIYTLAYPDDLTIPKVKIGSKTVEYPKNPLQPYIFYRINRQ